MKNAVVSPPARTAPQPKNSAVRLAQADSVGERQADRLAHAALGHSTVPSQFNGGHLFERIDANALEAAEQAAGGSHPLPSSVRSYFEPRFRANLSHVGMRADADGARAAQAIGARAFAVGHSIVFGKDEFHPDTGAGRELLAHEIAHTLDREQPRRTIFRRPTKKRSEPIEKPRIEAIEAGFEAKSGTATLSTKQTVPVAINLNVRLPGTFTLNHRGNGIYEDGAPNEGQPERRGFKWINPYFKGTKEPQYDWGDTVTVTITATASQRIGLLDRHIRNALTTDRGEVAGESELEEIADAGELLQAAGVTAPELELLNQHNWERERTTGESATEVGAWQWAQALVADRKDKQAKGQKGANDLIGVAKELAKEPLDWIGGKSLETFLKADSEKSRLQIGARYANRMSLKIPANLTAAQKYEWLVNLITPVRELVLRFEKLLLADLRYHAHRALDAAEGSVVLCDRKFAGIWQDSRPAPAFFWRHLQAINNRQDVLAAKDWRAIERAKVHNERFIDQKQIEGPYGLPPSPEAYIEFSKREDEREERLQAIERTFDQQIREDTGLPAMGSAGAQGLLTAGSPDEAISTLRSYLIYGRDNIRSARKKIADDKVLYGAEVWIAEEKKRLNAALGSGSSEIARLVDSLASMRKSETSFWQDLLRFIEVIAMFVPGPIGWGLRVGTAAIGLDKAVTDYSAQKALHVAGGTEDAPSNVPVALAAVNVAASAIPTPRPTPTRGVTRQATQQSEKAATQLADDAERAATSHGAPVQKGQAVAKPGAGSELPKKPPPSQPPADMRGEVMDDGIIRVRGESASPPIATPQQPASLPKVEMRTSKTPNYGRPVASATPVIDTSTKPMRRPPGRANRGSVGSGSPGKPEAYPKSSPVVEQRRPGSSDLGELGEKPIASAHPTSRPPDPLPIEPERIPTPRGPPGHIKDTAKAAEGAEALGLVNVQKGQVGMQQHRAAAAVREATEAAGKDIQSVHLVPQAVYKQLGISPDLAPTINLPRVVNNAIDAAWVRSWKKAKDLGTQFTGKDLRELVTKGIRGVPEEHLSQQAKNALEWAFEIELRNLGIVDEKIILPAIR